MNIEIREAEQKKRIIRQNFEEKKLLPADFAGRGRTTVSFFRLWNKMFCYLINMEIGKWRCRQYN